MNRILSSTKKVSKEEILIIGEIIHLRMQRHPLLIKDRRQLLRTHPCCFSGREVVEWLIKNGEALSDHDAVACMRVLQEEGVIHHVTDEHMFKGDNTYYRYRIDDGTFFVDTQYEAYHQAIMIHQRILGDSEHSIIIEQQCGDQNYNNSFSGRKFVSWLVTNEVVKDHAAAIMLAQHFLHLLLVKPINDDEATEFYDDETSYRFIFDVEFSFPLYQVLRIGDANDNIPKLVSSEKQFGRLSLQDVKDSLLSKFWNGDWRDQTSDENPNKMSDVYNRRQEEQSVPTLTPVVLREVTAEELTNKESPYYSKNITIQSDSVGFGFIIRGNGPCYVQAVDPTSPAADAGLKVRMYLHSVNGVVVLNKHHKEVAKEILRLESVELVVLQNLRSST